MAREGELVFLTWRDNKPEPWSVHGDYRVVASEFLQPVGPAVSEYDPLEHQEIATEFAKLHEGDEKALVRYARTWGLLGWQELAQPSTWAGDPLPWIWGHSRNVRLVLELYDYLERDDNEMLAQFLEGQRMYHSIDGRRIRLSPKEDEGPLIAIAYPDSRPEEVKFGWREPASLTAPLLAEEIICTIINANLQGQLTHAVFPEPLSLVQYCPAPLIAIYWRLAQVVTERRPLARCEECDEFFVVTDRRQRFCPPAPPWKSRTRVSLCGARARDRRRRERKKEG